MDGKSDAYLLLNNIESCIHQIIFSYMVLGRFPGDNSFGAYSEYLARRGYRLRCMLFCYDGPSIDEKMGRMLTENPGSRYQSLCMKAYESFLVCLDFHQDGEEELHPEHISGMVSRILGGEKVRSYAGESTSDLGELSKEYLLLCKYAESAGGQSNRSEGIFRLYALEEELLENLLDGDMENVDLATEEILRQTDETNHHDMACNQGYFGFLWRYIDRAIYHKTGMRATTSEKLSIDHALRATQSTAEALKILREFVHSYAKALDLERTGSHNKLIQRAKDFIRANCTSDVSLERVSNQIGLSSYYLSKLFKKEEGINYRDFVTTVRMEKAYGLLCEGKMNVGEVAAAVGYGSVDHFTKNFKNSYGVNPRDIRRGMREKKHTP